MAGLGQPRKLERADDRSTFESGASELDEWLRQFAWENLRANNAVTYVTADESGLIAGYYAIAVSAISRDEAPGRLQQGAPRAIPCILLARLAVDKRFSGMGLGAGLLRDALQRAAMLSENVGARAVLIHARDEDARRFYEHNADCLQSPLDDLQLMIPMKDVRNAFLA